MDREIHLYSAIDFDSVRINTSLIMITEWIHTRTTLRRDVLCVVRTAYVPPLGSVLFQCCSLVGENITVYNIMLLATQADRYCTWCSLIMWQCHCDTTSIWCHPKSKKLTIARRFCHKLFANVWRIFFHNLYKMFRFCVSAPCGTSFLYWGCQRGQCFTDHNNFHCQVHSDHSWIVGREN